MAKTHKTADKKTQTSSRITAHDVGDPDAVARQAPADAWSPAALLAALQQGTRADRLKALKAAGILNAKGDLTPTYQNWGKKVTRTPTASQSEHRKV